MEIAPKPDDELLRLDALYRYEILDTEAEELFDDLTQLASSICETPIALVSLIDANRQWFKSNHGLEARETSRDLAFCAHAILEEGVFTVNDASQDRRFADNDLVAGHPEIRFYAGAPLVTQDDFSLGTLCVIDREPRDLRPDQKEALVRLSKQAMNNLEIRLQVRKLRELNENNSRMLSIVSHDIRSPLCTMVSIHEMLQDSSTMEAERREQFIDMLRETTESALKTAEDFLALAQSGRGFEDLELQNLDLNEILDELNMLFNAAAVSKNINLHFDEVSGVSIVADPTLLHSILKNLLSNAIKFTNPHGRIQVTTLIDGNSCLVSVDDNGRGIHPDVIDQLFSEDSAYSTRGSAGEKGSGMGLSLCRRFAKRLGGDLSIESSPGEGCRVTLKVPLAPEVKV